MSEMTGLEKLRILLPHWLEHNNSHIAEFNKWQEQAKNEGDEMVAIRLQEAVGAMVRTGEALAAALEDLGGPLEHGGHHHHHD